MQIDGEGGATGRAGGAKTAVINFFGLNGALTLTRA
jgi:hypothetical protein